MTTLADATFSGSAPVFYPDYLFNATALANAGTVTSETREFGCVQNALELVITTATGITVADLTTLSIDLYGSDTSDGTFTLVENLASFAPSGSADTIDADAEIVRIASKSTYPQWIQVRITSSADQSAATVTGTIEYISR